MSDNSGSTNRVGTRHRVPKLIGALALVGVVVGGGLLWLQMAQGGTGAGQDMPTFTARRGPLTISVVESGTIKARDQLIIKNEVEGRTSIITLVPEGTRVHKGDLLVELDASSLQDGKIDQEIKVQNAEAAYINAQENLAIVTSQAISDVNQAELNLEFAEQDLRKYELGQYPKDVNEARKRIGLAQEELERAEHTLEWSNRLFQEKYVSEMEKTADELAVKRKTLEVELANADLAMLQDFTYPRQMRQFQSAVQQAGSALERAQRKAQADTRQADADLKAKDAEYARQKAKLEKIEDQIKKTKIYAPSDGLVIYATGSRGPFMMREPLAEGQQVVEKQELINMPTTASTMAEVGVHEASLAKVRTGQPAIVTVEILPGKRFLGTVGLVAPLPDSTGMFLNPDLKVFNTQVYLDTNDPALRSGMTCKAEIIIEQYEDTVYVPVQAVTRIAGEPTVYVYDGKSKSLTPRTVEIGLDNNRMIRIVRGLEEGEVVVLDPPLKSSSVDAAPTGAAAKPNAPGGKADGIDQQVRERLDASRQSGPTGPGPVPPGGPGQEMPAKPPQGGPAGATPGQTPPHDLPAPAAGQMPGGMPNLTPEQQKQMQDALQKMTPEQRRKMQEGVQKAMKVMQNLSEEEKQKLQSMSRQEQMEFLKQKMGGDQPQ
jgi:HlyD family secretion protein